ncbi:MAG: phage tail tape measure protein [Chitinophagaceae bacterium]|nr:phage tail tape measure protein [Chitinophagaceae bacterium]MDP1763427.1 phage tail tape measure protein [Sediminibacterium sp.]
MSDVKNKRVVIFIDQAAAEDALGRLQVKADGFNTKIANARKEQEKLLQKIKDTAAAGGDIKKLEARYNELGIKINGYNKSLKETGDAQLKIKQQIDSGITPSFKQMENYVSRLRNELKRFIGTQEELDAKSAVYKKASADLDKMRTSMFGVANAQRSWLQEAKVVAFGVLIGNTIQSAVGAISGYISGIVSGNAKMSDSLAKVQQTTGLASAEVRQLASEFKKIDTRTAQSDLLKIAEIGGQFNVAKEDLLGFVEQIDRANVVLGSEFSGGAEQITTELALLRNVFTDIKSDHIDKDLGNIGNALVTLAQEGAATAPVVSDFAKRLSPLISTAKLTSGEILGLSATMQELAINPERGGTAMVKLFDKMISNADSFARVAGVGIREFKNELRDNPFAAFQKVLEGFKKGGSDVVALNAVIQDMETQGVGAKEVLVKLSQNIDLLSQRSNLATESLKKTDKITEQFSLNNNTLGAEMDKLGKKIGALVQSETITNFIVGLIRNFSSFIDVLKAAPQWIKENQNGLYLLAAGLGLLNANYIKTGASIIKDSALKIYNATVTKITAITQDIATRAQMAYIIALDLVKGRLTLAAAAQQFYNYAMGASLGPIGIILGLIGAAAIAYHLFAGSTKAVTAAQQRANEELSRGKKVQESWASIQETANQHVAKTVLKLHDYEKAAHDVTKTDIERKKAIDGIIAINPKFFGDLDLEATKTGKLTTQVNNYIDALTAAAQQKALFEKRVDLEKELLDLTQKRPQDAGKASPLIINGKAIQTTGKQNFDLFAKKRSEIDKSIADVNAQIAFLDKKTEELNNKIKKVPGIQNGSPDATDISLPPDDKEIKKQQELLRRLKDFEFELQQVGKKADEKEIDRIKHKYEELIGEAVKHGLNIIEVEKEKDRAVAFLLEQERQKLLAFGTKLDKENQDESYKRSIQAAIDSAEQQKEIKLKQYTDQVIDKKRLDADVRKIDIDALDFLIAIAQSYINGPLGNVKKAEDDLVQFKKKKNKEAIDDKTKSNEELAADAKKQIQKDRANQLAAAELRVLVSTPHNQERLKAELNLLEVQKAQELSATELTEQQKAVIRERYRQKENEVTIDFYASQINEVLGYISNALSILDTFNQARNNKEKALLDKELKANDARRKSIESLAKNEVITEQEKQKRLAALDAADQKKKDELEKKQLERGKRIALTQALINGAMGITAVLAAKPGAADILSLGAFRAINIAFTVGTTLAQIAAISGQKFGKGGVTKGAKHIQGGINMIDSLTGQKVGEMEGNEPYMILSDNTYRNNKNIVDTLLHSSMHRNGAPVLPQWQTRPLQTIDYTGTTRRLQKLRHFKDGGIFDTAGATTSSPAQVVVQSDPEMKGLILAFLKKLDEPFVGNISFKKIEDAAALKNTILNEASMR